jgi:gluconokinase
MKYIIGIDIGTGSAKAVAVNLDSEPFDVAQHHYPTHCPQPGYSQQDPELIWAGFRDCIVELVVKHGPPLAISLSSAMHSLMPVDQKGKALSEMLTWADSRGADIARRIRESSSGMSVYETTGTPVYSMSPLCKIIWIKENQPEIFKNTAKFISIKEYIWFKLFKEYKIDHSIASATGLFDIGTRKWSSQALELAGITEDQLSIPEGTDYLNRDYKASADSIQSLPDGMPFVIGSSDGCLANLGSYAIRPGTAALTIGTSGAVRVANNKPVYNFEAMTFSYCLDNETYICGGPVNNGGIAVQWLLKDFMGNESPTEKDYAALFESINEIPAGSCGLIFLPYLTGERAPIWDTKSCGTFFGIRLHHKQAFFARAVLEGVCYALNDVLLAVEQYSATIDQINVSGGFVASKIWLQILADITGKRLSLVQTEDASALGAAFIAMKKLALTERGAYPSLSKNKKESFIEPDPIKHAIYSKNFAIFRTLYKTLKDAMHQIHSLN